MTGTAASPPSFGRFDGARRARTAARCAATLRVVTAALASSLLAGCTLGPDFAEPAAPATSGYTSGGLRNPGGALASRGARSGTREQVFAAGRDVPAEWWRAFGSRPLDALVEAALARNPTIEAAEAAIRIARENALAQRATLFPQIGLTASAIRQKAAGGDLTSPLSSNTYSYNLFTPGIGVTYTPDIFGGTRRGIEALDAQAESQRFQAEAAALNLATSVVTAAIGEASLRGQIDAVRRVIALQDELLATARKQLQLGQATGADVEQQVASLAQSRQLLPPLEKQLAQQRNLLTALTGRFPADEIRPRFTLASLRLPASLPVRLPGELVRRRPDVRAAEANLHAASAEIGVAIANRFPQVTLSATAGLSATQIAALAAPGAQFYTLGAALAQPLFDGGLLYHRQRAAEETFNQAEAQYRSTVLSAFQNVADALRALQSDAGYVAATRDGSASARRSVDLIRRQLLAGGVGNATLLLAQQVYLQALVAEVQAQAARLNDTAALFQALGGGGWPHAGAAEHVRSEPGAHIPT